MPRRNQHTSEKDRRRIVDSYERNEDFIAVTETLGVTRCTAYSITRRFLSTGEVARVPVAGGRPPKLDQESVDFLQMLMKANPCTTLREMNATLREIFSRKPQITTSTIFRALEGELITLKQANNVLWK